MLTLLLSSQLPDHAGLLAKQSQRQTTVLWAGEKAGWPAASKRPAGTDTMAMRCHQGGGDWPHGPRNNVLISCFHLGWQRLHTPQHDIYKAKWVSPCLWYSMQWKFSCYKLKLWEHWKCQVREARWSLGWFAGYCSLLHSLFWSWTGETLRYSVWPEYHTTTSGIPLGWGSTLECLCPGKHQVCYLRGTHGLRCCERGSCAHPSTEEWGLGRVCLTSPICVNYLDDS